MYYKIVLNLVWTTECEIYNIAPETLPAPNIFDLT